MTTIFGSNNGYGTPVTQKVMRGGEEVDKIYVGSLLSYSKSEGGGGSSNSSPTGGVTITGTATEGQVLTANTSTLADADGLGTLSYQWNRSGSPISGATNSTYTLTQSDVSATISVTVSYTDGAGNSESVTSSSTSAVASGGSSSTPFTEASGLTSEGSGTAEDPLIFSGNLADTDPIVTVGDIGGGYVLVDANVNGGSSGDDDETLSLFKNSTSVGNFFETDSWSSGSYKFTLVPAENDTLGLSRSYSSISTSSVDFSVQAETSTSFAITKESDSNTNSSQTYVEFSLDNGFPDYLWGIKVSISGNRVLYGSTTAFTGAVIYQERFTTQPSSLIYNFNRSNGTGNTNSSIGDVLDLKRFIVNGEPILRLYNFSGNELSDLTINVEPVTHLKETITNIAAGTITGAALAEVDN